MYINSSSIYNLNIPLTVIATDWSFKVNFNKLMRSGLPKMNTFK